MFEVYLNVAGRPCAETETVGAPIGRPCMVAAPTGC